MCPRTNLYSRITAHARSKQGGFSIVTAIFLIVVLAALGIFIVSVTGTQQASQTLDIQGVRAYQAARAGIEWGAYQVLDPGNASGSNLPACPAATNLAGLAGSLSPFTVSVSCTDNVAANLTEGNRRIATYTVVSTACNQAPCPNPAPGSGYVERRITAVLTKCKDPTAAAPGFACG